MITRKFTSKAAETAVASKGVDAVPNAPATDSEGVVAEREAKELAGVNRNPYTVTIPHDTKEVEAIVAHAILERRRRQYIQEYPGGPIDRYLPPSDPYSFLIESSKLTPAERKWQVVFTLLPWLAFAVMIATPFVLLNHYIPRAEAAAGSGGSTKKPRTIPPFRVVPFHGMVDIIERPMFSIVLLFSETWRSKMALPMLIETERLLRYHEIPVAVAAMDVSGDDVSPEFLKQYPASNGPYIQFFVPQANDAENGVVDYNGGLSCRGILHQLAQHTKIPKEAYASAALVDARAEELHDEVFGLYFCDDTEAPKASWWRRMTGMEKKVPTAEVAFATALATYVPMDGLDTAVESCRAARDMLKASIAR